jgi:hypothetical protein
VGLIVLSTREPVRIDAFRVDPRHCPPLQRPQQHDFTPMTQRIVIRSLKLDDELLRTIDHRKRNQLLGCMHAHNELTFLNRLLLFSQNSVIEGKPPRRRPRIAGKGVGMHLPEAEAESGFRLSPGPLREHPDRESICAAEQSARSFAP